MAATEIVARLDVAAGWANVAVGNLRFADAAPQSCQRAGPDEVLELVYRLKLDSDGLNAAEGRRRGATHLLRYMSGFVGDTWQRRWESSGIEKAGVGYRTAVCDHLGVTATANRLWVITSGVAALFALDVVRPGFDFALTVRFNKLWGWLPLWRGDPDADLVEGVTATEQTRTQSACVLRARRPSPSSSIVTTSITSVSETC